MMIISSLICPTAIQSEIIFTTPQKYFKFFVASIFEILESPRENSNFDADHKCSDMIEPVRIVMVARDFDPKFIWTECWSENQCPKFVGPVHIFCKRVFRTGPNASKKVRHEEGPSVVKSVLIWIWVGFGLGPNSRIPFWFLKKRSIENKGLSITR